MKLQPLFYLYMVLLAFLLVSLGLDIRGWTRGTAVLPSYKKVGRVAFVLVLLLIGANKLAFELGYLPVTRLVQHEMFLLLALIITVLLR